MVACLPPEIRVMFGMLPRAISVSMVLLQPGSVLMSMIHVATKAIEIPGIWTAICGHFGVQGLCHHWGHVDLSDLCCHHTRE